MFRKEVIFRYILHVLRHSDVFPRIQPDTISLFRTVYEFVTKPHDNDPHYPYPAIYNDARPDGFMSMGCLQSSFRFLEEEFECPMELRIKLVASSLRLSLWYSEWPCQGLYLTWFFLHILVPSPGGCHWIGPPVWHTSDQFDSLVEYHLCISQSQDYGVIYETYVVLAALGGSPSTLNSKRHYIDTIIRFMGLDIPVFARDAALNAARAISYDVSSIGDDDKSLQYRFSEALARTIKGRDPDLQIDTNPFEDIGFLHWEPDLCYLKLLCVLTENATWHDQLGQSGHLSNCLAIADTLSSPDINDSVAFSHAYAVYVAHIFALIMKMGPDYPFFEEVQAYPGWHLILKGWRDIFDCDFFEEQTERNISF